MTGLINLINMCDKAIQHVQGVKKLSGVDADEMNLDEFKIEKINDELKKELEAFKELQTLTMNGCELISLDNFPKLDNLFQLELTDNKFPITDLTKLAHLKSMQSLVLRNTNVKKVEDLAPLKVMGDLIQLDIEETEYCESGSDLKEVFKLLPELQILNNKDQLGNEIQFSDDEDFSDGEDDEGNEDFEGIGDSDDDEDDEDDISDEDLDYDEESEDEVNEENLKKVKEE